MLKIGIIDRSKETITEELLQSLVASLSMEICYDACQPLDILIVNKIPDASIPCVQSFPRIIIANSDDKGVLRFVSSMHAQIITYGFNSKAAITASSHIDDGSYVICVQRAMTDIHGEPILPREFSVDIDNYKGSSEPMMAAIAAALICGVNFEYSALKQK